MTADVMVLIISVIAFCLAMASLIISVKRKDDDKSTTPHL